MKVIRSVLGELGTNCYILLDEETIRAADTAEKIKTVGWDIVSAVKLDLEKRMLKLESLVPGSLSLSSGGCNFCEHCTRETGEPCRQPDKMRYSLDAFGFDLSAITKDVFQIEILERVRKHSAAHDGGDPCSEQASHNPQRHVEHAYVEAG